MKYQLKIDTKDFTVDIGEINAGSVQVQVNGRSYDVQIENPSIDAAPPVSAKTFTGPRITPTAPVSTQPKTTVGAGTVVAPIPGLILEIKVRQGETVSAGQIVATMEAMKMENNLASPVSGTVQEIRVQKGSEVSTGEIIMQIE